MLSVNMPITGHAGDVTSNTVAITPGAGTITLNMDDTTVARAESNNFRAIVERVLPRAAEKLRREQGAGGTTVSMKVSIDDHEGDISVSPTVQVVAANEVEVFYPIDVIDVNIGLSDTKNAHKVLRRFVTDTV